MTFGNISYYERVVMHINSTSLNNILNSCIVLVSNNELDDIAKRRAKLKRSTPKSVSKDRAMVKHHRQAQNVTNITVKRDTKRRRVDEYRSISRDIMFLQKSPPRQEEGQVLQSRGSTATSRRDAAAGINLDMKV